ncbi:MAG: hypothetical protein ACJA2O_004601 [Candidatus Azotimanducaceae bacterium]|jgi:hypothetical protein
MIAENLIYVAVLVFILMAVGIVLTIIEFRYGEPKRQQERAEKDSGSVGR